MPTISTVRALILYAGSTRSKPKKTPVPNVISVQGTNTRLSRKTDRRLPMESQTAYKLLFADYPDVVNVEQMREMLGGICDKTAYRLLRSGEI